MNSFSNWILQTALASITPDNFMGVLEGSILQSSLSCPYRICITCTVVTCSSAKPNVSFIVFQCKFLKTESHRIKVFYIHFVDNRV
jgi:hypothetical protein